MFACLFAGCTDKEDPGAELNIFIDETTNFDPAMAYNDQGGSQFLSLVYEGLTKIDEKGKVQPAMAEEWKIKDNVIEFKIRQTRWSDGTYVAADDFVYAWKTRILDPEFDCDAASLLFYIENAAEAKNGDTSIDDVMIQASGKNYLTVTLKDEAYIDEFLYNCASVALSPVRQSAVRKITVNDEYYGKLTNNDLRNYSWGTISSALIANGPFYIKKINLVETGDTQPYITLERNKYYLTDEEKEEALQKFVTPYRLVSTYLNDPTQPRVTPEEHALAGFNDGSIVYNSKIPLANREEYKSKVKINDLLATYSYYFNTEKEIFKDANVRKALSMALDRTEIEKIVVFAKAADGLVSPGTMFSGKGTSFREKAGSVISTSGDINGAKALLAKASLSDKTFAISVRNDEVSKAVAEYAAKVWGQLGFTVTVETLDYKSNTYKVFTRKSTNADGTTKMDTEIVYGNIIRDTYNEALESRNFDVIGVDLSMLTPDPFTVLAKFAPTYSGSAYDFSESSDNFSKVPGATGYNSEAYDKLITDALNEKDDVKRGEALVNAEKTLLEDMPVTPVYYMQNAYLLSSNIKNVEDSYFGYTIFTEAKDKTYKYVPVEALIPNFSKFFGTV